jgi:hypothetical protein
VETQQGNLAAHDLPSSQLYHLKWILLNGRRSKYRKPDQSGIECFPFYPIGYDRRVSEPSRHDHRLKID